MAALLPAMTAAPLAIGAAAMPYSGSPVRSVAADAAPPPTVPTPIILGLAPSFRTVLARSTDLSVANPVSFGAALPTPGARFVMPALMPPPGAIMLMPASAASMA